MADRDELDDAWISPAAALVMREEERQAAELAQLLERHRLLERPRSGDGEAQAHTAPWAAEEKRLYAARMEALGYVRRKKVSDSSPPEPLAPANPGPPAGIEHGCSNAAPAVEASGPSMHDLEHWGRAKQAAAGLLHEGTNFSVNKVAERMGLGRVGLYKLFGRLKAAGHPEGSRRDLLRFARIHSLHLAESVNCRDCRIAPKE